MSDSVRKKWRLLKKNRILDGNVSEQNLRSRDESTADKSNEATLNKNEDNDETFAEKSQLDFSLERQTSTSPDSTSEDNLNESRNENGDSKFNRRYSTSPPFVDNDMNNGAFKRYDCEKCNLVKIFSKFKVT